MQQRNIQIPGVVINYLCADDGPLSISFIHFTGIEKE